MKIAETPVLMSCPDSPKLLMRKKESANFLIILSFHPQEQKNQSLEFMRLFGSLNQSRIQCTDRIIFSQTSLPIRPSAALDFLSAASATPPKIRLADERIFGGVSPDIIRLAH